jgi:hypothetical protein
MATTTHPARRPAAAPATDAERRAEDKQVREEAHQEAVEKMGSPEEPTPTQAEADAMKAGVEAGEGAQAEGAQARQQRDMKPDSPAAGYRTR